MPEYEAGWFHEELAGALDNLLGQLVATLHSGEMQAGHYTATFNGVKLASGVYVYRLEAAGTSISKKLVLIK